MENPFFITAVPDIQYGEVVAILIEGKTYEKSKDEFNRKFHNFASLSLS